MRLLFDEDFNQRIVRGLVRRLSDLDFRSAHDTDLTGKTDDEILSTAAAENRLVVSHDVTTMTAVFSLRLRRAAVVSGLLLVPQRMAVGDVIADLELVCIATESADWTGLVDFLPL